MMTTLNPKNLSEAAGFTIIELMIATVVFSAILLVILFGVISFTNSYYRGNTHAATQATLRAVADDITQSIQFGGGCGSSETCTPTGNFVCIGDKEFAFQQGVQLNSSTPTSSNYGLYEFSPGTCPDTSFPGNIASDRGAELLGPHMRITNFGIAPIVTSDGGKLFDLNLAIAYGDADLLCDSSITDDTAVGSCAQGAPTYNAGDTITGPDIACRITVGSQFCDVASLHTTVQSRVVH